MVVLSLVLGLVVGSFLNVVIVRLPKGRSVVLPRSHCPNCGRLIRWFDNIPLLSFILLRGKCRSCKKKISFQYPAVEATSALLSYAVYWKFGPSLPYLLYFFFLVAPLIAVTVIDFKLQIIPDKISLPGIPVGILVALIHFGFQSDVLWKSLIGMIVGGGTLFLIGWLYEKLRNQEGLGMGDVKLAAMLGAFFGWEGILLILAISSLLGSLVGVGLILIYRKSLRFAIPFGPFLSLAGILYLFVGPSLLSLYLARTHLY